MSKDKIVEAARKLFYRYGFKKVSMDEIAKRSRGYGKEQSTCILKARKIY